MPTVLNSNVVRLVLRSVATIAGVLGLVFLFGSILAVIRAINSHDPLLLGFAVAVLTPAPYLCYLCYLTWFNLSPATVRQICGLVAFVTFIQFSKLFDPGDAEVSLLKVMFYLVSLGFTYIAYDYVTIRACCLLFTKPDAETKI